MTVRCHKLHLFVFQTIGNYWTHLFLIRVHKNMWMAPGMTPKHFIIYGLQTSHSEIHRTGDIWISYIKKLLDSVLGYLS